MYIYLINLIIISFSTPNSWIQKNISDRLPNAESSSTLTKVTDQTKTEYEEFKIEYHLKEISGLALSFTNKGLIYLQENSGNEAVIYVISEKGKKKANFQFRIVRIKTGKISPVDPARGRARVTFISQTLATRLPEFW